MQQFKNNKNIYLKVTLGSTNHSKYERVVASRYYKGYRSGYGDGYKLDFYKLKDKGDPIMVFKNIPLSTIKNLTSIDVTIIESDNYDLR